MKNTEHLTATELGDILTASIIKLDVEIPNGTFIAALKETGKSWTFLYEQGSDYIGFLDGQNTDEDMLEDWMPRAIFQAIEQFEKIFRGNQYATGDMEWFREWAVKAQETIELFN